MKSIALRYILVGLLAGALITAAVAFVFMRQQTPEAPPRSASVADLPRFETVGLALPTLGVDRSVRVYL
ncbi:MAG: hypothetical protein ACOVMK_00595, partial [Arenimonas sp.]